MKREWVMIKKVYVPRGTFDVDKVLAASLVAVACPWVTLLYGIPERVEEDAVVLGEWGDIALKEKLGTTDPYGYRYSLTTIVFDEVFEDLMERFSIKRKEAAKRVFRQHHAIRAFPFKKQKWAPKDHYLAECDLLRGMSFPRGEANGSDEAFYRAFEFGKVVIDNWMRALCAEVDYSDAERAIWEKAAATNKDGIYILEADIPWHFQAAKHPYDKAKVIIRPSRRRQGTYSVEANEWLNMSIAPSGHLFFLHPGKWIGSASTLEDAIAAAKESIQACSYAG